MAGSEPGEMNVAEERMLGGKARPSRTSPRGKFDIHVQTSKLSQGELDTLILECR